MRHRLGDPAVPARGPSPKRDRGLPPSDIDPREDIIAVTRDAAAEIGIDARPEGIDATYDGALLRRLAGVPSPAFGAGDLARAHAPDEWIGVAELLLGARAYARAIWAWCGVAG